MHITHLLCCKLLTLKPCLFSWREHLFHLKRRWYQSVPSRFVPAVGGVTARGQPSAAKGSVLHVSVPGARRSCTLSAFEPHPTAGQERLLHHHHPTDRFLLLLSILTSNHLKQLVWGGLHHFQLVVVANKAQSSFIGRHFISTDA